MVKVIEGDLFEASAKVICHQVNCQGVMNSGVAFSVKQKYPQVFNEYKMFCTENKGDLLGKILSVKCQDGKVICNLFAQDEFGYDGQCYTSYEALKECFESIKKFASEKDEIAMPYLMGCHRGGGNWHIVYKMIEDCFETYNVVLYKREGIMFNPQKTKDELIEWIKDYFAENGTAQTKAVIGISGGKDSSIVAALCVEALGKERVIGVLMPQGEQHDIDVAYELCKTLDIKNIEINIDNPVNGLYGEIIKSGCELNNIATFNTPARIRMTALYAISGIVGGRVANTCNLSEDWVGYATKFGDAAGDFSPLSNLTVTEVKAIGREIGLSSKFIDKTPIDGLCGKTDEDNLGFTYEMLDKYIREGICKDDKIKEKIDLFHKNNLHKLKPMPAFKLS